MKRLTCEVCGGTDLIKQEDVFVCENCGCKYSLEEVKKLLVEGTVKIDKSGEIQNFLRRVFMFLEDSDWKIANEYCERVLDLDPENAEAYLGKLMAELHVRNKEQLKNYTAPFDSNGNYNKIICFGDEKLKSELYDISEHVKARSMSIPSFAIDRDKCGGCCKCIRSCPADAIVWTGYIAPGHRLSSYAIDAAKCIKCGACVTECIFNAIYQK